MTLLLFDQSAILRINFKQNISPVIMAKKCCDWKRTLFGHYNKDKE